MTEFTSAEAKFRASSACLSVSEIQWRDKHSFLYSRGYTLRPRLRPDWTPSWATTNKPILQCEDTYISPYPPDLIDAIRVIDGRQVYLKRVRTESQECCIAKMFSLEELRKDPHNHCAPILDVFPDDEDMSISYLVTPLLRGMDSPPFETVNNAVDFIDQTLEGVVFMHRHGVAHRDCAKQNILMDADNLFPLGFHPIKRTRLAEDITIWAPSRSRIGNPVKYYFIDFGLSVHMSPNIHPRTVVGAEGRDQEVPELSWDVPYDPFKVDIFILGNLYKNEFYAKYANVKFLLPLIQSMTQQQPEARPDAEAALRCWYNIRKTVSVVSGLWRLRPRDEATVGTVIFDSISLVRTGVHATRRLCEWLTDSTL